MDLRGIAPVAKLTIIVTLTSDVKSSRPKFWPRPRRFGHGLDLCLDLGLGLASISLSYYVIGHFSCKNRVKFENFVIFFPALILNYRIYSRISRKIYDKILT